MRKSHPIIKWLLKSSYLLFISVLMIIFVSYTRTIVPLFYKYATDYIIKPNPETTVNLPQFIVDFIESGNGMLKKLFLLGIALVLVQALRAITMFISGWLSAKYSDGIAYKIRTELYNHIQNLSYAYHNQAETGDLIQRSTSDVETIRRFVGNQLPEIFRIVFLFAFVLMQMLAINKTLTFFSIIVVPFIFVFAIFYFKRIRKVFTEADEAEARMQTALQENLTGIRVVKAFAKEKFEIEKFDRLNRDFSNHNRKIINNMALYWSVSDFICFMQIIATTVVGAIFAIKGTITVGDLFAFSSLVTMVLWPIRQLGRIIGDLGKSSVSIKRIEEILNEPDEFQEANLLKPEIKGHIQFTDVDFIFPDANVPTLKKINLEIKQGETLAILGKTGSGKSTLAHLLVRLYDYTGGSIKIDGVELKEIDKRWIRQHVGIILQEPFLFSKTIYENIGILADEINSEQVYNAAKIASIHDDIQSFEQGYQTLIGERGVTLSGGQRQRVAIARMLIKNIPILIFDDSLSAVDTETDLQIRTALKNRPDKLTNIIITHRVSTAMEADHIVVLEDGQIIEEGTHEKLVNSSRVYKNLWNIQNSLQLDCEGVE